ncbi:MAG TPA: glycosyltransferase, partial [archaeon]|nr:glycosyltransferase [archaeon]
SGRHNKKLAIWVSDNTVIKQLDTAINYANNKGMKLMVVGLNGKSTENVEYFGKVPHEKMPEMYNKAGTFVMFISMPAPPLVLLEAMACGLNTITSDVEIIPKGRDGLCRVKAKDARKLALYYDWNKVAKRHLDVYEKVFGGFVS